MQHKTDLNNIRPSTTKIIQATRIRSQTAQKELSIKRTTASTGNNESKNRFKNHPEGHSFLFQNSWIPNSYRLNSNDGERVEVIIPKKIPVKNKPICPIKAGPQIISNTVVIKANEKEKLLKKITKGMDNKQKGEITNEKRKITNEKKNGEIKKKILKVFLNFKSKFRNFH